jgi:superfamily II DNA or RNA helicase
MDNYLMGKEYEQFIKMHLLLYTPHVWTWEEIPEKHLISAGFINDQNERRLFRKQNNNKNPLNDTGIDILFLLNNKYTLVQCKYGYKNGVGINDLCGFFAHMFKHKDKDGRVYYTSKLTQNLREIDINDERMQFIKLPMKAEKIEVIKQKIIELYDYQKKPVKDCIKHFKWNNRGIISFPCGTGKTIMSCYVAREFSHVVIISPYKTYAEQNIVKFTEYFPDYIPLLIDSDGTRDINEINKFIEENKDNKMLFSATFKSVDIVNQFIGKLGNNLCIIDEFHNLSRNNVSGEDKDNDIYKLLISKQKILFASATPRVYELEDTDLQDEAFDNIFGKTIASMSFSSAIKNKRISNFKMFFPSVSENYNKNYKTNIKTEVNLKKYSKSLRAKCMFILKGMLDNDSKRCITYCKNTKTMYKMKKIIEELSKNYYAYDLDVFTICHTDKHSKKCDIDSREWKLKQFQESEKKTMILSVKILDECIDVPKCDSIYISHVTGSKIRAIQRMCRCLRLDPEYINKAGHVYIWCNEYAEILNLLSGIKEYDPDFQDKIFIQTGEMKTKKDGVDKENEKGDLEKLKKFTMGIKEFRMVSWSERLQQVKKYIDENNKRPSQIDKNNEIKQLGQWTSDQQKNYATKKHIMANKDIYDRWTEFINSDKYREYFLDNDQAWKNKLQKVKKYIDENNKRPSNSNKNNKIKQLASWINTQLNNYTTKKQIMANKDIYDRWTEFINSDKYKVYFLDNDQVWNNKLQQVKKYIDENNKRPPESNKNNEIKQLGSWISHQQKNYAVKKEIMKNKNIYDQWTQFINRDKYSQYFLDNDQAWKNKLQQVKKYIDENNKRPSNSDKNGEIKQLASWINTQQQSYVAKKYIMANKDIYDQWTQFINSEQYSPYFLNNNQAWNNKLQEVKKYIDENNKRPPQRDKNNEIKRFAQWISNQQMNYSVKKEIMTDKTIYDQWTEFINSDKYSQYFLDNDQAWKNKLQQVKKYINENNKRPSCSDKNNDIKQLGSWISTQQKNYAVKKQIMANKTIYDQWTQFINSDKYSQYFLDNDQAWKNKLQQVKKYIDENNKRPSQHDKNNEIKQLGAWINHQQQNYATKKYIMADKTIYNQWTEFINSDKYSQYFKFKK